MSSNAQSLTEYVRTQTYRVTSLAKQPSFPSPLTYLPRALLVPSSAHFSHMQPQLLREETPPSPALCQGHHRTPRAGHGTWNVPPSKGRPAHLFCYWFRITTTLATQLNTWTGLDKIRGQDALVPSTLALPWLLWPPQLPQFWLEMSFFPCVNAHLTFSFF